MARPRIPIGISKDTLRCRKKQSDQLGTAIERARARGTATISSALVESARSGNVRAQIFFLKTRGGWQRPLPAPTAPAMTREEALGELIRALDKLEEPQHGSQHGNAPEKPAFYPAKPRKIHPQTPR